MGHLLGQLPPQPSGEFYNWRKKRSPRSKPEVAISGKDEHLRQSNGGTASRITVFSQPAFLQRQLHFGDLVSLSF